MHACWVDMGQDVDPNLLKKHGIDSPYFDARDPRITAAYLDRWIDYGLHPGLYYPWNADPTLTGPQFAEHVHADLKRIGWMGNAPVCLDIETHSTSYILGCLQRWRQLRPSRFTSWTLEGMQGGLFTEHDTAIINRLDIWVAPQFYVGQMQSHGHSVILDLLMAGFRGDRMIGMYDAARLPFRWTGFAFTQGRLPA